jgi:hypothetical protein
MGLPGPLIPNRHNDIPSSNRTRYVAYEFTFYESSYLFSQNMGFKHIPCHHSTKACRRSIIETTRS